MQKNVEICDDCNKELATRTCCFCGKSLCNMCSKRFHLKARFYDNSGFGSGFGLGLTSPYSYNPDLKPDKGKLEKEINLSDETTCTDCKNKFKGTFFSNESRTIMLDTFKKLLLAEKVGK